MCNDILPLSETGQVYSAPHAGISPWDLPPANVNEMVDDTNTEPYTQCRHMAARTQIAKWGNSLGLRLPKAVAAEAQVGEGDTVVVRL